MIDAATGEECPRARFGDDRRAAEPRRGHRRHRRAQRAVVVRGLLRQPRGHRRARAAEGWYWTGDLGYRDEDGTFFFAGRTADWLRVDGENFAAGPVEQILGPLPRGGVGGRLRRARPQDRRPGHGRARARRRASPSTPTRSSAFLAEQPDLGTKWAPRFVRIVEAIPVTATGKVYRKPLRADRWTTDDPVWWRPERSDAYRRLTTARMSPTSTPAFRDAGREGMLT